MIECEYCEAELEENDEFDVMERHVFLKHPDKFRGAKRPTDPSERVGRMVLSYEYTGWEEDEFERKQVAPTLPPSGYAKP